MAWSDEIVREGLEVNYFLRIDGIPYWFFVKLRHEPTGTLLTSTWTPPTGVSFRDGFQMPGSIEQSVKLFDGRSTVSSMTFQLVDFEIPSGQSGAGDYFFSRLFATGRSYSEAGAWWALATSNLGVTATLTFTVNDTTNIPATPFDAYYGLETLSITARVGSTLTAGAVAADRGKYPAVDGAGLGQRHAFSVDGINPTARLGNTPDAWIGRRVSLNATWWDERTQSWGGHIAPDVPVGNGTSYQTIWTGRLQSNSFEMAADKEVWSLHCTSILEDLNRKVMSRAAQTVMTEINLLGLDTASLTLSLNTISTYTAIAIPAAIYSGIDAVLSAFNTAYVAASPPADLLLFMWRATPTRVRVLFRNGTGASVMWHLKGSGVLSSILGLAPPEGGAGDTGWRTVAAGVTDTVDFEHTPVRMYTTLAGATINVASTSGFAAPAAGNGQGDGVEPALTLDGMNVPFTIGPSQVRYNAVTATSFTLISPYAGTAYRLVDDDNEIGVRQLYRQPTGVSLAVGRGVFRMLLRFMTSTGTALTNGPFDVFPDGYGLAIPAAYIDTSSFTDLEDSLGEMASRHWEVDEPTALMEVLLAECKTIGAYLVMNTSGQIAIRRTRRDLASSTAVALNEDNKAARTDRCSLATATGLIYNAFTFHYGHYSQTDDWAGTFTQVDPVSQQTYEYVGEVTIENRGLQPTALLNPEDLAAQLGSVLQLYRDPSPVVGRSINRRVMFRLLPGDVVTLTDSGLPNMFTGARGVSGRNATVTKVAYNLRSMTGRVEMIIDGLTPDSERSPLCPSARVTAFDGGTNTVTIAANEFTAAPDVDVNYFLATDAVLIVDGGSTTPAAPTNTNRTIVSVNIGANTITLDGDIGGLDPTLTPVYLTFGKRAAVTASQVTRGTHTAATSALIQSTYRARKWV